MVCTVGKNICPREINGAWHLTLSQLYLQAFPFILTLSCYLLPSLPLSPLVQLRAEGKRPAGLSTRHLLCSPFMCVQHADLI